MGAPPKVLVIDDDEALLRVLRLSLASDGFDVTTAADGAAGLEKLDEGGEYDVVVLDLQMPRLDGRSFYREMVSRGHKTRVLILSAYGAEEARRELGAAAAIGKPFDPDHLSATVRDLAEPARA
jgi:two-component system, OmpR family, response regulator MprA